MGKKEENKKNSKKGSKKPKKDSKKPKKVKELKVFCGITDPIPKGFRLGSMKECLDKGQVRYYGIKKIDNKVIEAANKKPETEADLQVKAAGFRGKLTKLKRDLDKTDNPAEKQKIKTEYEEIRKQLLVVGEKINKIKNKV
jgi:hypothetical protein